MIYILSVFLYVNCTPVLPIIITKDNSCGIYSTNITVCNPNGPGPCCSNSVSSSSGWCGNSELYCSVTNCILNCTSSSLSTSVIKTASTISSLKVIPTIVTIDNSCGIYPNQIVVCGSNVGPCCSNVNGNWGWCGSSNLYCALSNCLFNCTQMPITLSSTLSASLSPSVSSTLSPSSSFVISTDGTCGSNVICPNLQCCSSSGYCGSTIAHCGTGCQSLCNISAQIVTYNSCNKAKQVAITFDDGPGVYTENLLAILKTNNVQATFFLIGYNINSFPQVVKDIYAAGHTVGSHTYTHPDLTTLSANMVQNELLKTDILIKSLIGISPKYFRPPYSAYNILIDNIAKSFNYKTILVGLNTQDYNFPNSTTIVVDTVKSSLIQPELTPGGPIICQHDIIKNSVNQVDSMIKYIKSQGYTIVSLDTCLA